jgi:cytochrome b561
MSYSRTAVWLHWSIAVLIIAQLAGGLLMVDVLPKGPLTFTAYQMHKTFGLIVLALTLSRIYWRLINPAPPLDPSLKPLEAKAAHLVHLGFYGMMFLVPFTGWLMVSTSKTAVPTLFFMQESLPFWHLPNLTFLAGAAHEGHELLAKATILLLVLHVGGALKHQLIDKHPALARMTLKRAVTANKSSLAKAGVPLIAVSFIALGLIIGQLQHKAPQAAADAPAASQTSTGQWAVVPEQSDLSFATSYSGAMVKGVFDRWSANINFDPNSLENARIEVSIDIASVRLSDSYLNAQAPSADGFDTTNFPTARFLSTQVNKTDAGYEAIGTLELKGKTVAMLLPFMFAEQDGTAIVSGRASLNRIDFGIGTASAPDEGWLKHAVDVTFNLTATRQ